jgi:hypothetical protein
MTYTPTLDVIINGSIAFAILWVALSVVFSVIVGSCTAKDSKEERCGHIQCVEPLAVIGSVDFPAGRSLRCRASCSCERDAMRILAGCTPARSSRPRAD